MTFTETLAKGQLGEDAISLWLMKKGYAVLPAYQVQMDTGKGPRLFTAERSYIAPDLLAFTSGKVVWIEAKHKTGFTWHRLTSCFVTGIDLRHYSDYIAVQERGHWAVHLMFLHDGGTAKDSPNSPSGLYGQSLSYLTRHEHHRHANWGKGGMVYWDIKDLRVYAPLAEVVNGGKP